MQLGHPEQEFLLRIWDWWSLDWDHGAFPGVSQSQEDAGMGEKILVPFSNWDCIGMMQHPGRSSWHSGHPKINVFRGTPQCQVPECQCVTTSVQNGFNDQRKENLSNPYPRRNPGQAICSPLSGFLVSLGFLFCANQP